MPQPSGLKFSGGDYSSAGVDVSVHRLKLLESPRGASTSQTAGYIALHCLTQNLAEPSSAPA